MTCSRCRRTCTGSVTKRGSNLELGVIVVVRETRDGFTLEGIGFAELGETGGFICRACLREIVDTGEAFKRSTTDASLKDAPRVRRVQSSAAVAGPLPAQESKT